MMAMIFHLVIMHLLAPTFATVSGHGSKLSSKLFYRDQFDSGLCLQEASCIPLHNASCFGTSLPYTSTSIALAEDSISQFEVQDNLALWQGLRSVPRCWAVVQPLLCAIYMPKCENGSVFLPSQEMCRITRGPCRTVEAIRGWPPFLQCENKKLFPPRCRNPLQEVKFNTSYKCVPPLVETDNPDNYFHEVQGCGLQCQNPFYTKEEHNSIHSLLSILVPVCFAVTSFTVVTFMISWKAANRYPAVIIFYINVCLAIVSFGWMIQFFPGAREEIVCSYDGTIRRKQPRSGEHLCSITFVLIYYFLMASLVWFVILTYAWHVFFKQTGTPNEIVKKKVAYFHISAWSIPLVLTTTVMAMTEVDGDSMSGICFVGYADMNMRIGFLLAPVGVAALIGGFFMACVLYTLIKVKLQNEEVANVIVKKKIRGLILKIGVFSAFAVLFIISTFACHAYDFLNRKEWEESLKDYIVCLAMNSANRYPSMGELPKCQLKSKPSVGVVRIHLFCLFGYGIIMSLWVWTRESVESWKRFLYRLCEPAEKDPAVNKRYKFISEAYKRRHELHQGRFSSLAGISLSTHDDPIGMTLDIHSIASRDLSSSWAAAIPRFLDRRNAVPEVIRFMPRQYSSASDMSHHRSFDSFNQPNLDSLSMQLSEKDFHFLSRHQRRKTRKERERLWRTNRIVPTGNRRGSDTSLQSSLVMAAAGLSRRGCISAKVTKSTSTGDLGVVIPPTPGSVMFPPIMFPPPVNNRPQFRREETIINPPFTHGMTDNSHHLGSRVPSVASALPRVTSGQRYTPSQCSVMPNSFVGMVRPPVYSGSFNVLNAVPYSGYFNNGMYPPVNGFYPGYAYPEYMYTNNPYLQYATYAACNTQYQQDILPMNPIADSASETDFFPIKLSDSEYTDTGMRSHDESQLMFTQLLMQEHLAAQEAAAQEAAEARAAAAIAAQNSSQQKSQEDCEAGAKTKTPFLKKIWPFNKTNPVPPETVRPPSGRKSAHSEAPPPSPAESSKSLNEDELDDDVFIDPEETKEDKRNVSVASLPHASETANIDSVFCKIKTKLIKFRRATSYINNLEKIDTIELTSRVRHSSLLQLSKTDSSIKNIEIHKEKWLHASEGISLMNGDASTEHVSR